MAKTVDRTCWMGLLLVAGLCSIQVVRLAKVHAETASVDSGFRVQNRSTVHLERAAELEVSGQIQEAEAELLAAADADRRFQPAWALANFYHRQHREGDFRDWLKRAAGMSYGDRSALFRLVPEPALLPSELRTDYTAHLLSTDRLEDANRAIQGTDRDLDLTLSERFLREQRFERALAVWNRFREPRLTPDRPRIVNGSFTERIHGLAFGWRWGAPKGVTVVASNRGGSGSVRIAFSGIQENSGELLSQYLVINPGRRYRLSFESRSLDLPGDPGLVWTLGEIAQGPGFAMSADWRAQVAIVQSTASFARLALVWKRPNGAAPADGELSIRNVRLEALP